MFGMRRHLVVGAGLVVVAFALTGLGVRALRPTGRAEAATARARRPHRPVDVTFLVTSDTHLGFMGTVPVGTSPGSPIDDVIATEIQAMNEIPGRALPTPGGELIAKPRGVLISGDLTDGGHPTQWVKFVAAFGLDGTDGKLHYPVFEGAGNHDKWGGPYVEEQIKKRHGAAKYAWDWDDLHLVCLGEAPDAADLVWLRDDLAKLSPEAGILLFLHFPLAGPNSQNQWFGAGPYRKQLAAILEGKQVLAIFSGHSHTSGRYRWEGHDAYLEGSVKHAWHSFSVVHVTAGRMTVASYNYDRRAFWWWHQKPIFGAAGAESSWVSPGDRLVADR
jgi:cytolysin (calcineurin-like family phosphatase)